MERKKCEERKDKKSHKWKGKERKKEKRKCTSI